jgi:ABC-type polar amino acid transport system ATPase subunit
MNHSATDSQGDLVIALDSVSKSYGARPILDGITLHIAARQTVALIGPSGGGKSTLLRCINGLCAFDSGTISVGPHVLAPRPSAGANAGSNSGPIRQVRRLVGMVFQDFQLFAHLTALENIAIAPRCVLGLDAGAAAERARTLLARVGLGDRPDAFPRQLSGGQKQRVAIARALAMQPRGLLCDEITSALDPELKHEVLCVLEDLKQEGLTLITVTHEMGFARRSADRVVVLADGQIVEDGSPDDVFVRPRHPRTQQFLERTMA